MRVWTYALKSALRWTVGITLAGVVTLIATWLIICGFTRPSGEFLKFASNLLLVAVLIGLPVSVISTRLEVMRNNRMKAQ